MKILRASVKGQPDKVYDEEKLAKLDEEQGRKRLSSGEVEALISLSTGRQLMVDGYAKLKEHAKYAGATRRLNMAIPMAYNAIQQMTSKVSGAQMITVLNNTNNVCMPIEYSTNAEIVKVLIRISSQLETVIKQNRIMLNENDGKKPDVDICSICAHRYWHDPECGSCNAKNRYKYFEKMDGGAEE